MDSRTRATSAIEKMVTQISEPIVAKAGLYLEDVVFNPKSGQLRVTVDLPTGPGSVDANQLGVVSREISQAMDREDPIASAYTLEISTPGATRQLKTPRHYDRAQGRLVMIKTAAGERICGRIVKSDAQQVTVSEADGSQTSVSLDSIVKAACQVELNRDEQ